MLHNHYVRFFATVLVVILICAGISLADESEMNKKVLAPSFVLFEADDPETYIYAKNPDLKIMPASTTKIMTCILALENCPDLDVIVSVPDTAVRLKSTNTLMGLKRNEKLPLIELLYGMMLPSGNDAAIAVATHVAGSVEAFAEMMNAKAQELGMTNTHFTNASGVYNSQHYSTCRDMGRLAAYAMKNEMFRKIVSTAEYDVPANEVRKTELHLVNTNRLVSDPVTSEYYYEYAIGCKTGSTEKGGKCLVAAAEKDGVTLIALFLGVKDGGDKSTRIRRCFTDAKMVFEAAYNTMYASATASDLGLDGFTAETHVENATKRNNEDGMLSCSAQFEGMSVSMRNDIVSAILADKSLLQTEILWDEESLVAPIRSGDILGTVTVAYGTRVLFTANLTATRDVEAYDPSEDITPSPAPTSTPVITPTPSPTETPVPEPFAKYGRQPILYGYSALIILLISSEALLLYSVYGKSAKKKHGR